MALWNVRTMAETEIYKRVSGRFANVQFANNRSRFANVLVLSLSSCSLATEVVGARDLCSKTGDHLGWIRFHLVEIWINV